MYKNKEKQKRYLQKYHQKIYKECKKLYLDLKVNGCAICGYNKCLRALSFHHVNPDDKKFSISAKNLRKKNYQIFIDELNKCMLLCSNCHMEIEDKEQKRYKNETKI